LHHWRGSRLRADHGKDLAQRHRDEPGYTVRLETEHNIATMRLQGLLDQRAAEAAFLRNADARTAALLPVETEQLLAVAPHFPGEREPAMRRRQRAVFARVGRKLVQDQRKMQRRLRIEHERRTKAGNAPVALAEQHMLANEVIDLGALHSGFG